MNEQPNDNTPDAVANDPTAIDNIDDVLLEFDKEPEIGANNIPGTVIDTSLAVDEAPVESTPSPFGPPLANFGDAQGQNQPTPSGPQPVKPVSQTTTTTVIQDVKPVAAQPPVANASPSAPVKDSIAEMVAIPKPASPASNAIESLISARDKVETKDSSKSHKDIKLPSNKKSKKGLIWILSSVVLLLVAAAAGWLFMIKGPADQAASNYKTQAISYLESIDSTMEQFSGDFNETLASLNSINRPTLENTLLNSFSYSNDYKDAENLQRNVNAEATKVISGVQAFVEADKLVVLNSESEIEGARILNQISASSTDTEKSVIYKEYIGHLESLKAEIDDLGALPEGIDTLVGNLVAAINTEVTVYSSLIIDEAEPQPETSPDDPTSSDDATLPATGDNADDVDGDTGTTPVNDDESDAESVGASRATNDRQAVAVSISEYLAENSRSLFDNLKSSLSGFIATIK